MYYQLLKLNHKELQISFSSTIFTLILYSLNVQSDVSFTLWIIILISNSNTFLVGSLCNCILPEALKTSTVQHDANFQGGDSEKKRLRTAFSCLSSISVPQREVSMSSLFLHSHYKGCLPPWELKRSRKGSLKERWGDLSYFL